MKTVIPYLHSINAEQRLFVIPCGDSGYSCLGFDVCYDRTAKYAEWLGRADLQPHAERGTTAAWDRYQVAEAAVLERCRERGERCPVELTPQLIGLEGKRVEVTVSGEKPRRFYVGKSTGPIPIHLEIATRRSDGGGGVYLPAGATVRVVEQGRAVR